MTDPTLDALRRLPGAPMRPGRAEAIRLRARGELTVAHRRHATALRVARVAFAFTLTGGLLGYLLWAMSVSRTFG